jgi:RHS repeat-associated protein
LSESEDAANPTGCPNEVRHGELREYRYDQAGNTVWSTIDHVDSTLRTSSGTCAFDAVRNKSATANYYGADGKLRIVDMRGAGSMPGGEFPSAYEESRYDALGRRVLHRTRDCILVPDCASQSTRIVWDGDQIADEIAFTEANPERDDVPAPGPYAGRVLYAYGLELDQPLTVTRVGYSASCEPFAVAPDWDWRGYPVGHGFYGPGRECGPVIVWPVAAAFRGPPLRPTNSSNSAYAMGGFYGSLTMDQRDASASLYRRNRYYDPETGGFTQEDPIGLAGGLNLYGYAGGDPVNFSDPFGLCPSPPCLGGSLRPGQFMGAALNATGQLVKEYGDDVALEGGIALVTGGTSSAVQAVLLVRHLRQLEKYGKAGYKVLQSGRVRYYGDVVKAQQKGEMMGRRLVREWDPVTDGTRTWHETLDHAGRVRQVRPETLGDKIHFMFDAIGKYVGKR